MKSETQTLTATVGKGTAWTSSFSLATKIVGLATTFLILSRLRVYEYGLLKLVLSLLPLLGFIQLPGITGVAIADMGVEKGKKEFSRMKEIFINYVSLITLLSIVAWLVLFFGSNLVATLYNESIAQYVRIASFSFLVSPIRSSFQAILSVYFKFFERALYSFIEEFTKFLGIAALFIVYSASIEGILIIIIVSSVIPLLFFSKLFISLTKPLRAIETTSKTPFWDLLRKHGKWSVFSSYLSSFGTNIRMWVVQFILGTEAVGLYALASGLIAHTSALFPLHSILMPIIPQYVSIKQRFKRMVNKGVKYQLIGNIFLGVIALIIFPPIISILFPQYIEALSLYKIMLLILIPNAFAGMFTALFFTLKGQKYLFKTEIIKTVLILLLAPIALLLFGLKGIAYEFVVTILVFTIIRYREIKKLLPGFTISMRDYIDFDETDRLIVRKMQAFFKRMVPKRNNG